MRTGRTYALLIGLCLLLAGCGQRGVSRQPASASVSPSDESSVPPCCVAEPSRAALLSGSKNIKSAGVAENK